MTESKATAGFTRSTSKESIISAVSHVGDWEIGDRCQIGGRTGNIVYIGPTRFAPGEWIGIVLDESLGKNDGCVDGHRYFSCEPNYGLFCKASKLERVQSPSLSTETSQNNPLCKEYGLEIGDRVVVSGGKCGRLRFIGNTEFKDGVWAGIELDQPVGKNDGSVQGKRYFTCKAPYGLFAVASKVARASEQNSPKFKIRHTKTSVLRQRKGSHESLSSIGASSVASSRIYKCNLATPRSLQKPLIVSSDQEDLFKAIQESLKEKETHLEQLIRERDLERNEMVALSNRCELAEAKEAQLENAKTLVDQQLGTLKVVLDETEAKFKVADDTINNLTVVLKETKDALEVLTFRYDEEIILNAEMAEKIAELEKRTIVIASENEDTTGVLTDEIEKTKLQLEELKKRCSAFEQERLSMCTGMKNILFTYKEDFIELVQLLSLNDIVGNIGESGLAPTDNDGDLSKQLETNMKGLNNLLKHYKKVKKAVQERLESNTEEIKDLVCQLEILKRSMNDKADSSLQKGVELTKFEANMDQLRNELVQVERCRTKLEEKHVALELANNTLMKNFDQLKGSNAEIAEKIENERKEYGAEIIRLNENLRKAQDEAILLHEQLKKMEMDRTKLVELQKVLENSNKKLLSDLETLELQKIELEGELRQKESDKEILNFSLQKKEVELASTNSKISDLIGHIDKLRSNLSEASCADETLKKELESLREENSRQAVAYNFKVIRLQRANESLEKDLSATRSSFQALEKMHNAVKNTLEKTQSELIQLKEELSSSQQALMTEQGKVAKLREDIIFHVSAEEQLRQFQEEVAIQAKTQTELQSENNATQQMLCHLEAEKETLLKEKNELQIELTKIRERFEELTQSLDVRVSPHSNCEEMMLEPGTQSESEANCQEFFEEKIDNLLEEEIQPTNTEKRLKVEIEKLIAEKAEQANVLTITAEKSSELEHERSILLASLNKMEKEQSDKDAELNFLKMEMINIRDESKNKEGIIKSLEAERAGNPANAIRSEKYEEEIDILKKERDQAISAINSLKREILELSKKKAENEGTVLETIHRSVDLEKDWKNKEIAYIQEIQDLRVAASKTASDKIEEMKQDISFLHSIIAEQCKKEENLKEQIAVLNSLPANEIITELQHKTTESVTLRLYCDICEVFDVHDTTDCSTQAMDVDVIPKKIKKVKPPPRPYCHHCEEFGHEMNNCSKIQSERVGSKDYTF